MKAAIAVALAGALAIGALAVGGAILQAGPAAAVVPPHIVHSVGAGLSLPVGTELRSGNGRYRTLVRSDGDLLTYGPRGVVWYTATRGASPRLAVQRDGNLALYAGKRMTWNAGTVHSGYSNRLLLSNGGILELVSSHGIVWSSHLGNGCRANRAAKAFLVTIHNQLGRFCAGSQQVLTAPVTTGASAFGDGTPRGRWHVYAKVRDTHLFPAAGGDYFVHYWMPYSGAYGVHDSPWQNFPYGSQLYATRGSHGCIHLPGSTMAWFFGWAPTGTTVQVAT